MEATWQSIQDLVRNTNFKANIQLSLIDVDKQEAYEDIELNLADIAGSELFKKIYIAEYDQFGGYPYGGIIGMYPPGAAGGYDPRSYQVAFGVFLALQVATFALFIANRKLFRAVPGSDGAKA